MQDLHSPLLVPFASSLKVANHWQSIMCQHKMLKKKKSWYFQIITLECGIVFVSVFEHSTVKKSNAKSPEDYDCLSNIYKNFMFSVAIGWKYYQKLLFFDSSSLIMFKSWKFQHVGKELNKTKPKASFHFIIAVSYSFVSQSDSMYCEAPVFWGNNFIYT